LPFFGRSLKVKPSSIRYIRFRNKTNFFKSVPMFSAFA
jgi:hypothetical protein